MRNIEKFDEITGIVFAKLYDNFPMKVDLNSGEILNCMEEVKSSKDSHKEDETFDDLTKFIPDTIRWLKGEGYITMQMQTFENKFIGMTLTGRGLSSLKAIPDSVSGKLSTGEELSEAVKLGGKEALIKAANQALSAGFKLVTSGL